MKLTYRLWLFFGGARTERGFRYLSDEILRQQQQINDLSVYVRELEWRAWQLEHHTPEETAEKLQSEIRKCAEAIDECKAACNL